MQDDEFQSIWFNPQSQVRFHLHTEAYPFDIDLDYLGGVELDYPLIIDSPIESQTTPQAQNNENITSTQGGEIPKRVNNNIFKTPGSVYRKCILEYIKRCPSFKALRQDIQEASSAKNMSVFPKLNFMVRWLKLDPVASIWMQRKEQMLAKKKKFMENNRFKPAQMDALKEIVRNINDCIKEDNFDTAFKRYWGKYRQHSKHQTCWKKVHEFCEQFKKDNPEGVFAKKQDKQEAKQERRRKNKKTKIIKKTKKNAGN